MQNAPMPPHPSTQNDSAVFQPYAPPGALGGRGQPHGFAPPVAAAPGMLPGAAVALYSANQVALATFLGTPLGGSVIMAINERRLGRPQAAVLAVVLGALASAVLVGIGFLLPDGAPTAPLGLVTVVGLRLIAHKRQHAIVDAHTIAGGKRGSGWAAAGIGIASAIVVLVPVFVIAVIAVMASGS